MKKRKIEEELKSKLDDDRIRNKEKQRKAINKWAQERQHYTLLLKDKAKIEDKKQVEAKLKRKKHQHRGEIVDIN